MDKNWGVFAGFLGWGIIALVIWASPDQASRQIFVQGKWMDRAEVIAQSETIQARANNLESKWMNTRTQLEALQTTVHTFCEDNDTDSEVTKQ